MLNDDLEQKMKEKLLEGLIEHMEGRMGDRMTPEAPLGVTVEAADKPGLADGLDKAKDVLDHGALPEEADAAHPDSASESDEDRLLQLLEEDEEDEDEKR